MGEESCAGGQRMIGEQQRRVDVESRVRKELERIGLYRLPVNPIQVAHRLGISVKYAKFPDGPTTGMVATNGGSSRILAAKLDSPYHLRFTIAHELGHYFLHLMEDNAIKDGEVRDRLINIFLEREPAAGPISEDLMREIEANWFAIELLMPMEFIREEWNRNPSLTSLARMFGVTEDAIGYRVADLDLWVPAKGS